MASERMPAASWCRERPVERPKWPECPSVIEAQYDRGKQCRRPATFVFEGQPTCYQHHPIRRAEAEAWRVHRSITALEADGFTVSRRSVGKGE